MKSTWRKVGKIVFRTFLVLFTTVLLLVGGVVGLVYTFNYGPSPSARSLFVTSVLETSAVGFLATWFLPAEEVQTILATNKIAEFDVVTNPNLISIPEGTNETTNNEEHAHPSHVNVNSGLKIKIEKKNNNNLLTNVDTFSRTHDKNIFKYATPLNSNNNHNKTNITSKTVLKW